MKLSAILLAIGASAVVAQDLSALPKCGQTCVGNMLGLAQSLGCKASDYACLCSNKDFGYGIRDCSNQACTDPSDAAKVISYGTTFCANIVQSASSAGVSISGSALSILSSAASTFGTAAAPLSTPVSTSAILSVVSTGGSAYTTVIGESTIYGAAGSAAASVTGSAASAASSAAGSAASAASSAEGSAASAASSAISAASSAAGSAASAASSAAKSGASAAGSAASSGASGAASSTGAAPRQTAAPILGGAALAALLLI